MASRPGAGPSAPGTAPSRTTPTACWATRCPVRADPLSTNDDTTRTPMRVVKILLVLALLAGAALFGGYRYWESRLEALIAVSEPTLYEVPRGAGYNRVVADLARQGLRSEEH